MKIRLIVLLALLSMIPMTNYAQQQPIKAEEQVDKIEKTQVKMFDVKHRDADKLADALRPLLSNTPRSSVSFNKTFRTITVRDLPENIAVIETALKRLDTPESAPTTIEFQLHLIAASQTSGEKVALPANLEAAINQLKMTLRYTNYRYMTTLINRVNENGVMKSSGKLDHPFPANQPEKAWYAYEIINPRITSDTSNREVFSIPVFEFGMTDDNHRRIGHLNTQLSLRDSETTVIGTANAGGSDQAIIVIVSAKKVK